MRGKVLGVISSQSQIGITPAYAGKRSSTSFRISSYQDHPRLCGEKFIMTVFSPVYGGSPPPMRGKADKVGSTAEKNRITPAYAGKSLRKKWRRSWIWDHPRLCGEKLWIIKMKFLPQGSPPPMRGKVISSSSPENSFGITPAYAGKSPALRPEFAAVQDHPRLCGEKLK